MVPDLPSQPPVPAGPAADSYTLTVHTDGCGVVRSEGPDGADLDGLTWSVTDADGFEVLGRNALGETRYRYISPGTFTVVLESWGGDSYGPVSDAVSVSCRAPPDRHPARPARLAAAAVDMAA